MACAAPTASSSKETTNFARLCRLLVDVGTQALRDTLDGIHAPATLHRVLARNRTALQSLRTRKIVNVTQWGKLFPAVPTSVLTAHFDTTLLMILLRNICGLPSPATGWDALPAITDVSREADIARVKYFRNTVYAHAEHASVDDVTFNTYWQDIRDTLVRLGGFKYKAAIDNLETECMDPDIEDYYKELLNQWKKDEDSVKDQLKEITRKLDDLKAASHPSENTTVGEGKPSRLKEMIRGAVMCKETYHENEAIEYYCQECNVCICHKCGQTRHNQHDKMDIQQAAEEQKIRLTEIVERAKEKLNAVEKMMKKQTELMKESEEEISTAEKDVTEYVHKMVQLLKEHEKDVKTELATLKESQQGHYQNSMENFQLFGTQLRSSVEYCEGIVQRNISNEILQAGHAMLGCCDELLNTQEIELYKPQHVMVLENDDAVCEVVVSDTDQSESMAEGKGLKEAELGAEATFTVTTRDSDGIQFYNDKDQVSVKICSPTNDDEEKDIQDFEDGNYTVRYRPQGVGLHDISVEVNRKPLTGSPWSVPVTPHHYSLLRSLRSCGTKREEFNDLLSVAVSERTGNIAIADDYDKRVYLLNSDKTFLRTIGDKWTSTKKINQPRSVAFTASGDVIVIHGDTSDTYKMYVFTERGQFVKQIHEHLVDPYRVSLANNGNIITCDFGDKTVNVLSPDGTELLESFSDPHCDALPLFAVYHQDKFFVLFQKTHCIKVFDEEGDFLYEIGSEGSGDGQLSCPVGIAIDKFNNLIVCDKDNDRLQVFALDGKFVNSVNEVERPLSVAVTKDGHFLVCTGDRVQVFH